MYLKLAIVMILQTPVSLVLQADHLFTAKMADGNKARALLLMANHVRAANAIYKNTGFADKSKPEGTEFVVTKAVIQGEALRTTTVPI